MIYILEVPHQHPPRVWWRESREDIMAAIDESAHCEEIFSADTDSDEWKAYLDYNKSDLYHQYVYMSKEELRAAMDSGSIPQHQYFAVHAEMQKALENS